MGKKDLKEHNKDLEIHVVDLINKFDPSETGKYTGFLTKILKDKLGEEVDRPRKGRLRIVNLQNNVRTFKTPIGKNDLEEVLINYLTELYGRENMEVLFSFHKHTKENRIIGRDINSYKSWDDLQREVALATLKQNQKLLEKEVQKIVEDDEWLVVRPLTVESSLTYGAGTKWCTASRHNKEYFYRYSRNGVLFYVINKNDGDKYGLFYDSSEFSIWNAPDKRIDSIESAIPSDLMSKLYKFMKSDKPNYEYFSESEKHKCDEYLQLNMVEPVYAEPMPDNEYDNEYDSDVDVEEETIQRS